MKYIDKSFPKRYLEKCVRTRCTVQDQQKIPIYSKFYRYMVIFLALSKHLYVVYHMFEFQMIVPYQFKEISIYHFYLSLKFRGNTYKTT